MKKPLLVLISCTLFLLFSTIYVTATPIIELNPSLTSNITNNASILLLANFSDVENGFVGNITLNEFSDRSTGKNFTFVSNGSRTIYLNISRYSKILNATMNVAGDRDNVTNPTLETPDYPSNWALKIRPGRCRVVPPPVSFNSVTISAHVKFVGDYKDDIIFEPSGLIAELVELVDEAYQIIENKSCKMTEPSTSFSWESCSISYSNPYKIIDKPIYACVTSNDSSYYRIITEYNVDEDGIIWHGDRIDNLAETRYAIMPSFNTDFSSFPADVSIDMANNGFKEWINEGVFNRTETISNFSSEINRYLENCEYDNFGYCLIPSITYSNSAGIVRISNLNITYEENNTCQICIANDGTCDTEWTINNVTNAYSTDYLSGTCSYSWNASNYNDGIYNVSVRIKDTAYNTGMNSKKIVLDRTSPIINDLYPIDNGAFTINITNPENITNSTFRLTFRYGVNDLSSIANCSLIFNDKINNTVTSVNKYDRFNISLLTIISGIQYYNWSIACTDAFDHKSSTDTRKFRLIVMSNFSGETTDLGAVNLSKIENLTFEQENSGKIKFSEIVDLSGIDDINKHVKISYNRVEINSSAFPALNKSATLYLYNLTYDNPQIMRDGQVCPSTICKKVSYSNGTLAFNVSMFSTYSTEETSADSGDSGSSSGSSGGGSSGGGGGGGGGGGSGLSYTCNMDWECGEWSECDGKWETRKCDFVKVSQHTQSEECPSIDKAPSMARKCEIVKGPEEIEEAEETKKGVEEAKESQNQITGAAVGSFGDIKKRVIGFAIVFVVVVFGTFAYYRFFFTRK